MIVFNEKSCTWTDIRTVNKSFNKFTYNRIVGNDTSDSNNSFVDESNENGNIKNEHKNNNNDSNNAIIWCPSFKNVYGSSVINKLFIAWNKMCS